MEAVVDDVAADVPDGDGDAAELVDGDGIDGDGVHADDPPADYSAAARRVVPKKMLTESPLT